MARGKQSYENDAKQLITLLTSLQEDEENVNLCLDFALSNFKFHRFLDTNSHNVHRSIDGLCDKFRIHSQGEKADTLQKLVSEFLETPAFEDSDTGKTDTHYSILSLLICLSEAPTLSDYVEPAPKKIFEDRDDFDWTSYLNEGIDVYKGPFPPSPDWSDDELEDTKVKPKLTFGEVTKFDSDTLGATYDEAIGLDGDFREIPGSDWLSRNVVVQYWSKMVDIPDDDRPYRECNLSHDWETHLSNTRSVYVSNRKLVLTEQHIMRETLWLLMGAEESVIFTWNGDHYIPSQNVVVTHLTEEALASFLSHLGRYTTIVRNLYTFVRDVTQQSASTASTSEPDASETQDAGMFICQTYQAFASALCEYLQTKEKELVSLEKQIFAQDGQNTSAKLVSHLKPFLNQLDVLQPIYTNGITAFSHVTSVSQRASGLLSVLFQSLLEGHNLGEAHIEQVNLLMPLWIKSCRPYLDMIGHWLMRGELVDPYKEFIIQRNIDIKGLDENFWDTAFTLHCMNSSDTDPDTSGSDSNVPGSTDLAPRFLFPVLDHIILAGKSVELIQSLGKLSEIVRREGESSLYEQFIQSLETTLGARNPPPTNPQEPARNAGSGIVQKTTKNSIFADNIAVQMRLRGTRDPFLALNYANIFRLDALGMEPLYTKDAEINSRLQNLELDCLSPMLLLLEKCLYPHIREIYEHVSSVVLRILNKDYHLKEYFAAMKRYYLMEAGDVMYEFYTELFEKLRLHERWQDVSFLNSSMYEAIQGRHPGDLESVFVSVETKSDKRSRDKQPVTALEGLVLHYKVPWPVDVVLHSRCLRVYGLVFHFILQIKRVKYSLDELRFIDLQKRDLLAPINLEQRILGKIEEAAQTRQKMIHRMQIFRMKLMHFVNSLHNYIMTRILHSTSIEFQADLADANDLDKVIKVHNAYVRKLHERCLLHHRVSLIKDVVTKVLDLALTVAACWDEGIDSISESQLNELETEFTRYKHFLASFLHNIIKKGSFPHLESLVFALVSSNDTAKS